MTRTDFFKRVVGLCGFGALVAKVRPALAKTFPVKMPYMGDSLLKVARRATGDTFRWTAAENNNWCHSMNWEVCCKDGKWRPPAGTYPGAEPYVLDTVIIEHGQIIMPVGIAGLGIPVAVKCEFAKTLIYIYGSEGQSDA